MPLDERSLQDAYLAGIEKSLLLECRLSDIRCYRAAITAYLVATSSKSECSEPEARQISTTPQSR